MYAKSLLSRIYKCYHVFIFASNFFLNKRTKIDEGNSNSFVFSFLTSHPLSAAAKTTVALAGIVPGSLIVVTHPRTRLVAAVYQKAAQAEVKAEDKALGNHLWHLVSTATIVIIKICGVNSLSGSARKYKQWEKKIKEIVGKTVQLRGPMENPLGSPGGVLRPCHGRAAVAEHGSC